MEGVAWALEHHLEPPARTVPLPRPGAAPAFLAEAERVRNTLGGIAMVHDDATGWGLPPDRIVQSGDVACRINTLGLRGPELLPRAPDEERILTLGDSSVFGDGVPERMVFSSVAAARLSEAWGVPVSGVIGGVPGHDSSQSLARLLEKGAAVAPTWVLSGNVWSDVYRDRAALQDTAVVKQVRAPLRRFATYRALRLLLTPALRARKVGWIASMEGDIGGADGRARVQLRDYVRNLRKIGEAAKRLGARPAFVALPAPVDLDPAGPPEEVLEYREAMRTVARELDAPYVDAPAYFRDHGGTIGHFADQVHPNPHGHALLGEAVAEALASARSSARSLTGSVPSN